MTRRSALALLAGQPDRYWLVAQQDFLRKWNKFVEEANKLVTDLMVRVDPKDRSRAERVAKLFDSVRYHSMWPK
jgi:hypothetical protein